VIGIIDYGVCNVGSIMNMLKRVGAPARLIDAPEQLAGATKLILPGIGAFDAGMRVLESRGFVQPLQERVLGEARTPMLGICLGAQLMTLGSEEGRKAGLGLFDAQVHRFRFDGPTPKVPHMGWNLVTKMRASSLTNDLPENSRFYFVHSYFMESRRAEDVLLTTNYGAPFHSALCRGNLFGVQFHPEKSHKFGMMLLRNFATWVVS
jgi:glutamine amidotransferase